MNFDLFPLTYPPRAQISNHRRACTQALLLYIKSSFKVCSVFGATLTEHKDPWVVWKKEKPANFFPPGIMGIKLIN